MTSEVVIMNRRAIVLAADSAVTVTSLLNGRREKKYLKGANKVFELSNHQPVAVMIFNMADLHSVPWEIIIKSYREHLGNNSFPSLQDYAKDLFLFVQNHTHLFPPDRQDELFKVDCISAFFGLLDWINKKPEVVNAADIAAKNSEREKLFNGIADEVRAAPLPSHFRAGAIDDALLKFGEEFEKLLAPALGAIGSGISPKSIVEIVVSAIFKNYERFLNHTGIVIAGFGDQAYFPGFVQFDCYGILLGSFIADKAKEKHVTVDDGSDIQPFAMNDMVRTFMSGLSPDIFDVVMKGLEGALSDLAQNVGAELNIEDVPNLAQHAEASVKKFQEKLVQAQADEHYLPLTRAVASLPVDELASLAETLIMLESLKEKVTRPSESVGGPVDVAAITKSEGLVWIKRKHYFPSELNSRFIERQRQRLT